MHEMIREGVVSVVYPERCSCRVTFPDRDNLVSAELPILQPAGARNKHYNLVDVGDSVICIMPQNARDGTGFVIGSRYDDSNNPPADNQNVSMLKFPDGTSIRYDRGSHDLFLDCVGDIHLSGENIYITGEKIHLNAEKIYVEEG